MEKILSNYFDYDRIEFRTALFNPVENFEKYIEELNNLYSGSDAFLKLLAAPRPDKPEISLIAETYQLCVSDVPLDNRETFLNENFASFSPLIKSFILNMYEEDSIYVADFVKKIALPGQEVKISYYDSENGNYDFSVKS